MIIRTTLYAILAALVFTMAGCAKEEGAMEKVGKSMDEAAENVGKAAEDAAKEVKDAVSD